MSENDIFPELVYSQNSKKVNKLCCPSRGRNMWIKSFRVNIHLKVQLEKQNFPGKIKGKENNRPY